MHAVVAATVGVVGKELIGCKFNVSGCCGAVRHRIAPAIDDMLRPAASGEKADAYAAPQKHGDEPQARGLALCPETPWFALPARAQ